MSTNEQKIAKGVEGVPDGWVLTEDGTAWVYPASADAHRAMAKMARGEPVTPDEAAALATWALSEIQRVENVQVSPSAFRDFQSQVQANVDRLSDRLAGLEQGSRVKASSQPQKSRSKGGLFHRHEGKSHEER